MSGLHYDSILDVPAGARQQVTEKIVVKVVARRVAAEVSAEERLRKIKARRLEALKDAQLEGAISDLKVDHKIILQESCLTPEGVPVPEVSHVADFTYRVLLPLDHWLCCCDIHDLEFWHQAADQSGTGVAVIESLTPVAEILAPIRELLAWKGYILREV